MSSIEWVESNFDYIIIDEAHYLFQDALFNRNTEIMLDMVEQVQKSKVFILMSATADLLKEYFVGRIKKTYFVQSDYSYIKTVYCYTTPDTVNKIKFLRVKKWSCLGTIKNVYGHCNVNTRIANT